MADKSPDVYRAISAVQAKLAQSGIGKDSENTFDRYKFRGIDQVYNTLAPLLAEQGLNILPRMIERENVERVSKKGDPMFYVTVTAEFDFVAASDGSMHTIRTYGEAMDRSDKATNKAMSAAYKYAAFMAFAIPTEGDNDADASTPEVAARGQSEERTVSPSPSISSADLAVIHQLCAAVGGGQEKLMMDAYKIGSLNDLTPNQAKAAIDRLKEKLAAKVKEETNAMAEGEE